jgi:hypothetical protein
MRGRIDIFRTSAAAEDFFKTQVLGTSLVDGILIKQEGKFAIFEDNTHKGSLEDGESIWIVIQYPKGTGVTVDANK